MTKKISCQNCQKCQRSVRKNGCALLCNICSQTFHLFCACISGGNYSKHTTNNKYWYCKFSLEQALPFMTVHDTYFENLFDTVNKSSDNSEILTYISHSLNMKMVKYIDFDNFHPIEDFVSLRE